MTGYAEGYIDTDKNYLIEIWASKRIGHANLKVQLLDCYSKDRWLNLFWEQLLKWVGTRCK
jgi:hypothetical protein